MLVEGHEELMFRRYGIRYWTGGRGAKSRRMEEKGRRMLMEKCVAGGVVWILTFVGRGQQRVLLLEVSLG